jgi:hypothetical protein
MFSVTALFSVIPLLKSYLKLGYQCTLTSFTVNLELNPGEPNLFFS